MNLKFSKNASKDIEVLMQDGAEQMAFSYIEMIKGLLNGKTLSTEFAEGISEDEKKQIDDLIDKIKQIAGVPMTESLDLFVNSSQE